MLVVHHLENSRLQRILWMLEELQFDYELRHYKQNRDMTALAQLKNIHPLGKSPAVEDRLADGKSIVLVETGAICEYLVEEASGQLGPGDGSEESGDTGNSCTTRRDR